jgi:hypothetical protein
MKRTGYPHMGHFNGKYKLSGKITDQPLKDCRDRNGSEAYSFAPSGAPLPPIPPAWPPATGSAHDMLRSPQQ